MGPPKQRCRYFWMGPQPLPNNVADNSEWAHQSRGVDNTGSAHSHCRSIQMGPLISSQKWPMISYGPRISSVSPAEPPEWAHWSLHRSGRWSRMGPGFLRWVLPKHLDGPINLSVEVVDDFAWAQNFFGESCRSICMGPLISSQKWPMISYGPRISSVSPAEPPEWAHWSLHRSGRWFRMGPEFLRWVLLNHLSGPIDLSIEVANDFAWAQDFFGESCQSIWVGSLISSQKWPMILYGPRISSVRLAEPFRWAHRSPYRSGRWFRMGPYSFW
jgi:hypothetical protein